jgi:acyl carrier protein
MESIEKTRKEVIQIVAEKLKREPDSVKDTHTLQDLGADSLDIVEIIMNVEDHFDIAIDDQEAEKLYTIADVVRYVHQLQEKK